MGANCRSRIGSFLLTPLLLACIALGMLSSSQFITSAHMHWWYAFVTVRRHSTTPEAAIATAVDAGLVAKGATAAAYRSACS